MNAMQSRLTSRPMQASTRVLGTAIAFSLCLSCSAARSEVMKAVKRVIPATVAVQWRATDVKIDDDKKPVYPHQYHHVKPGENISPDVVSLSSGTVVSDDGLIVTLIAATGEGEYSVTLDGGRTLPARLVVDDRRSGLYLLKVDAGDLAHVELASDETSMGELVVAAACTSRKGRAVTQGIVSATGCSIPGVPCHVVQADVLVGAMSAGGPLVDGEGRLVGIIAAKAGRDVNQSGFTFAIPVRLIRALIDVPRGDDTTVVHRGYIGIVIGKQREESDAPTVHKVIPDQPAAAAGIQANDEILAINQRDVSAPDDVVRLVGENKAGDKITVTVRREDKEQDIIVTLAPHVDSRPTAQVAPPKVRAVYPAGKLLLVGEDGRMAVVTPDSSDPEALLRWHKRLADWPRHGGNPGENRNSYVNPTPPNQTVTPTIRVERSDLNKKVDRLSGEIQSLKEQFGKLGDELKKLNERLSQPQPKGTQ